MIAKPPFYFIKHQSDITLLFPKNSVATFIAYTSRCHCYLKVAGTSQRVFPTTTIENGWTLPFIYLSLFLK